MPRPPVLLGMLLSIHVPKAAGNSFREGIAYVTVCVFGVFAAIAALDLFFARERWESIGTRLERWSRTSAWFVFLLIAALSTLVVHFVGNRINY